MIKIMLQCTHMKIFYDEATEVEQQLSEDILTTKFKAEDSKLKYSYAVKRGFSSSYKSFYIEDKNLLPVGFLPHLEYYYKEENISYEIIDLRKYPSINKPFLKELMQHNYSKNGFAPRDYQVDAVITAVKNKGGILQLSMGSGKSYIAYLLTQAYSNSKILLIFNAIELIHQTRKMFIEYGIDPDEIGIIQGNNFQDDKRITLLSVQSYEKAFHLFPEIKVIIADECHDTASEVESAQSTKVLYACQNASVRFGLSATADGIDNKYRQMALYGNLGPIIFNKEIKEQVDAGVLASLDVQMYRIEGFDIRVKGSYADIYEYEKVKDGPDIKIPAGWELVQKNGKDYIRRFVDYGDESNHYVYNEERNKKIAEIAKQHKRVMILFIRKDHGKILKELLPESILVHGDHNKDEREKAKQFLKEHQNNIILASTIFGQGVDIPWIHTLILAGGGRGTVPIIQRFGRATRKHSDTQKVKATVIDFMDMFSPMAISQSNKRRQIYENKLGFKVEII